MAKYTGTAAEDKGIDAALQVAVDEADKRKPAKFANSVGFAYTVCEIRGIRGGINPPGQITVEIETEF